MNRHKDWGGDGVDKTSSARFLRLAGLCRTRDLKRLLIVGDLVKDINALIHALQKERGASSIFLGSNGSQFAERLAERVAESRQIEQAVRNGLEHIDERLDRLSSGARFYTRVALAFTALDALNHAREQIASLNMVPQDAIKAFTDTIAGLLAVIFEAADIAADPVISQALIALVNFSQGKEFAGQERATAGAAFSHGQFEPAEQKRLQYLVSAQQQAFHIFCEFCEPAHADLFEAVMESPAAKEVERMRHIALAGGKVAKGMAEAWFEQSTRRIDAMKAVEYQITSDLKRLCIGKLAEASSELEHPMPDERHIALPSAPVAVMVTDADPTLNDMGAEGGVSLYTLGGVQPKLMRSILDVIQAQSRRLHAVSHQLESMRTALNERKVIDKAKGILMTSRKLSEEDAYSLMRKTAMSQNKRIFDVAEAIVSMADILKG